MSKFEKLLARIRAHPKGVRYDDLKKLCITFFGEPRQEGTSHAVFRTPWPGDPRVNIQKGENGEAKAYRVRQILAVIDKLLQEGKEGSQP